MGRYCGAWQASTAGQAPASFHLVLHGDCFLHLPDTAPIALHARDGLFLLRDIPHFLSPERDPAAGVSALSMLPLRAAGGAETGTGLACGFFQFRGAMSGLIMDSFPPYLVCRSGDPAAGDPAAGDPAAGDPALAAYASLFDLILAEAGGDPDHPSPLMARLVELLFFYLIRHAAQDKEIAGGLLALARRAQFMPLLDDMLRQPGAAWSIASMARSVHMSRHLLQALYRRLRRAAGPVPADAAHETGRTAPAGGRLGRTRRRICRLPVERRVYARLPARHRRAPGAYRRTRRQGHAHGA